jgi:exopolysaccharide production protein ExoQ
MDPSLIVLLIAAICLSLLAVIAAILKSGSASNWPGRMFQYLMLLITMAGIESILLSSRDWRLEDQSAIDSPVTEQYLVGKIPLMVVIGYAIVLCVAWGVIRRSRRHSPESAMTGLSSRSDIMWSFMGYYVAFSILPMVFGEEHYFHVSLVYPLFVYLALFLWVQVSSIDPVVVAKQCLGLIVVASLGAAILTPEYAVEPNYVGLIPGFDVRLWGVMAHANSLGSIACALLVLEAAEPAGRRWLGVCVLATAACALIMSQSKTAVGAALVGASTIGVWRLVRSVRQRVGRGAPHKEPIAVALMAVLSGSLLVVGALVVFLYPSMLASITRHLDDRAVGELTTATGRTRIWSIAVQRWLESPIFGQGANFWQEKIELRLGLTGATNAHNLLLQAFSCAGVVGVATLLIFLYFLFRYSMRAASRTRGGSVGVMAMFVVRSIFEVPIQPNDILGAETIVVMAYIFYVMNRGVGPIAEGRATAPARMRAA